MIFTLFGDNIVFYSINLFPSGTKRVPVPQPELAIQQVLTILERLSKRLLCNHQAFGALDAHYQRHFVSTLCMGIKLFLCQTDQMSAKTNGSVDGKGRRPKDALLQTQHL